mgnify:CR=1 FL=1
MSEFPTTARVVIIGGGVVGTSALYHLAKAATAFSKARAEAGL